MKGKILSVILTGGLLYSGVSKAQTLYGITTANTIFTMSNPAVPSSISGPYTISGVASGQMLVGIKSRPSTGWLYAVGYDSVTMVAQLYTITNTGTTYTASAVGLPSTAINLGVTSNAAMGFVATTDNQIRLAGRNGNSYIINADNGIVLSTSTSGLAYAIGDVHLGMATMAATAYTNSFYGADATDEVGYDVANNVLVNMTAGNFANGFNNMSDTTHSIGAASGILFTTGTSIGMDTWYDTVANNNTIYMSGSTLVSNAHLYKYAMSSLTGALTDLGAIGSGSLDVRDIAFARFRDTSMTVMGQMLTGLTLNLRNLVYFDSYNPQKIFNEVMLTGVAAGQSIIAIDYSASGTLYGFGYNSTDQTYQLYKIDTATGNVTAVNTTPISIGIGTDDGSGNFINAGFRFIATDTSQIRITGNNGLVNRLVNASTGAIAATDTAIQYITGDVSFGVTPAITSIAYTGYSNDTVTQMFGFDAVTGALVTFDAHNTSAGFGAGSSGYISTDVNLNSILSLVLHTSVYNNSYLAISYEQSLGANVGYLASNYIGDSGSLLNYSVLYNMFDMLTAYHRETSGAPVSTGRIGTGTPVKDIAIKRSAMPPTAVSVFPADNNLLVYPNPVNTTAHIVLSGASAGTVYVDVVDMNGNVCGSYQYLPVSNTIDLDMSKLPTGLYTVSVLENSATLHDFILVKQ